jgi:PAS domain S-box-containing protein
MKLFENHFARSVQRVWARWVEPSSEIQDAARRRQSRFLASLILVLIFVALLLGIPIPLSGGLDVLTNFSQAHVLLGGVLALLLAYRLNRNGRYRAAVWLVVAYSVIFVFIGGLPYTDTTHTAFLIYLSIPIIMAGLLLSGTAAAGLLLMSLLLMALLPAFFPSLNSFDILYEQGSFVIVMSAIGWAAFDHISHIEQDRQAVVAEQERRLRLITNNMHEVIFYVDAKGNIAYVSPSIQALLGYTQQELYASPLTYYMEGIHPDDLQVTFEHLQDAFHTHVRQNFEYRARHKDGHFLWVETIAAPLNLPDHEHGGIVFTTRDISERKQAQERVYAIERRRRALAESVTEAGAALTSTLKLDEVMERILSYVSHVVPFDAGWIGLIDGAVVYPVRAQGYAEHGVQLGKVLQYSPIHSTPVWQRMLKSHKPLFITDTHEDKEWVVIPELDWVRGYAAAPIHAGEQIVGFISLDSAHPNVFEEADLYALDAFAEQAGIAIQNALSYQTIQQHAGRLEQRVQESSAEANLANIRAETILYHSSDAILLVRDDRTIAQINPAFTRLFGYEAAEVSGRRLESLFDEASRAPLAGALERLNTVSTAERLEVQAMRKGSDETFTVDIALALMIGPSGEQMLVCSVRDISAFYAAREGLRQALEKEHEISQMRTRIITTVSHEFRTPLSIILSASDLLYRYENRLTPERKEAHLKSIQEQVHHMTKLVEKMVDLDQIRSDHIDM